MKRDTKPISHRNSKSNQAGVVRIISGQYRGRKLPVLNAEGLRPTTDRTKETVFNWLMHDTQNANCLDLFAGSGGLGFEALSRYAQKVTFVEKDKTVGKQLQANLNTLKAKPEQYIVVIEDAFEFIDKVKDTYDLIFIDPPFGKEKLASSIEKITRGKLLADGGLIYIEHETSITFDGNAFGLTLIKQKSTQQVSYSLWSNR